MNSLDVCAFAGSAIHSSWLFNHSDQIKFGIKFGSVMILRGNKGTPGLRGESSSEVSFT